MNFEFWRDELSIYDKDATMDGEPLLSAWQPEGSNDVAFMLREDMELKKEDDGYGNTICVIRKKS